jgi:hypothetical protein
MQRKYSGGLKIGPLDESQLVQRGMDNGSTGKRSAHHYYLKIFQSLTMD